MREIFRYGENPADRVDQRMGHQRGGGKSSSRRLTPEEYNASRGVYRAPDLTAGMTVSNPENRKGGGFVKGKNPLDALFKDPPKEEAN